MLPNDTGPSDDEIRRKLAKLFDVDPSNITGGSIDDLMKDSEDMPNALKDALSSLKAKMVGPVSEVISIGSAFNALVSGVAAHARIFRYNQRKGEPYYQGNSGSSARVKKYSNEFQEQAGDAVKKYADKKGKDLDDPTMYAEFVLEYSLHTFKSVIPILQETLELYRASIKESECQES